MDGGDLGNQNTHFVYKLAISTTPLDDGDDDRSRII